MDYTHRLARLRARMQSTRTDMVVLGPSSHMVWLSGLSPHGDERPVMLVVTPGFAGLLMPALNADSSRAVTDLPFYTWDDAEGPNAALARLLDDADARRKGLRLALETLGRVRLGQVGARAVGNAARLLALMTHHARDRTQFGSPIGAFQLVQQMLADSVMEVNAARLMLHRAAWLLDQGQDARDWIAMVKVQASEMLGRVADRAVQLFGGMGFSKDLPIERLYRDARVYRIFDGTSEIHRLAIARAVLRQGAALFDPLEGA